MKQTDQLSTIMDLLWQGKRKEAKEAVSAERIKLSKQKADLAEQTAEINQRLAELTKILPSGDGSTEPCATAISSQPPSVAPSIQAAIDKNERNAAIIKIAKRLGEANKTRQFYTVEVAAEVTKEGVNMGIPENRYNSVISRLLARHTDKFEPKPNGRFKLKINV